MISASAEWEWRKRVKSQDLMAKLLKLLIGRWSQAWILRIPQMLLSATTSLIHTVSGTDCSKSFWKRPGRPELIAKSAVFMGHSKRRTGDLSQVLYFVLLALRDLMMLSTNWCQAKFKAIFFFFFFFFKLGLLVPSNLACAFNWTSYTFSYMKQKVSVPK
jgi:hypothetical protein